MKPGFVVETLQINGMTCAACVRTVERAVAKVEGVTSVAVNLATQKAQVSYDPAVVRLSAIKNAVHSAGYEALTDTPPDEHQRKKEKEVRGVWLRFLVAAA